MDIASVLILMVGKETRYDLQVLREGMPWDTPDYRMCSVEVAKAARN